MLDQRTKEIILGQSLNLSQKEHLHLNPSSVDISKIKEGAKEYYKMIIELYEEVFGEEVKEKKEPIKIEL